MEVRSTKEGVVMGTEGERERDEATDSEEVEVPAWVDLMEYSFPRIVLEAALGAVAGTTLAYLLSPQAPRLPLLALGGAFLAPVSLLLTPASGPTTYRAVRYGGALALLGTLSASFVAGTQGIDVAHLMALGALLFAVGALGHGMMIRAVSGWT